MAGLIIKLTQNRLTGEKKQFNLFAQSSHKDGPKEWPEQADFILFRQRNNTFVRNWQDKEI